MQRIGFVVFPGFSVMTCAVVTAFELANREIGEPVYGVRLLSETGGSIRASSGISVGSVRPSEFRYTDHGRRHRAADAGTNQICASGFRAMSPDRRDLHRGVHPGRSRPARWPTRKHALEARA